MYDVNHDGCHKFRLVADGKFTDIPDESVYSGVVYLHGIFLLVFLSVINEVGTWDTYIGNKYLEANTLDKVDIISVTEFDDREFHIIIFSKALYII